MLTPKLTRRHFFASTASAAALLVCGTKAHAEAGVAADKVTFGQAAPLEGPASALGRGMRDGLAAAFAEQNGRGGVHGRRLELVSKDDGYEPSQSIAATEQLIRDGVFALLGPVGTPTSAAAHPIAAREGLPFIGPFTGAELLRNPYQAHIVNVRASYFQETEVMIERLTRDLGHDKIAIFYQDDAFGRAGLEGAKRALTRRNMELAAEGTFERNTTAVRGALLAIRRANPQAVVMIGPYKPCAEFIKLARQVRFNATFINISFVGSEALAQELGDQGAGVYVTQVVPFPGNTAVPVVGAYQAALRAANAQAQPGFISLEGYLVGRTVIMAMERAGAALTRASLMAQLTNGSFDLGGFPLAFAPNNNQGSSSVFLTVINREGRFEAVERLTA
jgi:ABC-type branched-subunit amino acid transport system substrate-binding protein